jgi:ABC-2 type transport system ATP-binding protein
VEQVLDDVVFIQNGRILLRSSVDAIREEQGKSVDQYFREVFRC